MKKYMSTTWLEYVLLLLLFTCAPWILHISDPRPILTFPSFQAWYYVLILPLLATSVMTVWMMRRMRFDALPLLAAELFVLLFFLGSNGFRVSAVTEMPIVIGLLLLSLPVFLTAVLTTLAWLMIHRRFFYSCNTRTVSVRL